MLSYTTCLHESPHPHTWYGYPSKVQLTFLDPRPSYLYEVGPVNEYKVSAKNLNFIWLIK